MISEIYFRDPTDPKYNATVLETYTELEAFLSKIRMIMMTNKGEVIGEPELGMNLEDLLFTFGLNELQLEGEIMEQIDLFAPESSSFKLDIQIKFFRGAYRDECLIDFFVDDQKYLGFFAK